MKRNPILVVFAFIFFAAACSSGEKAGGRKVVVFSSGKMQQDSKDQTTITLDPGNRHEELEISLTADQKTVTVKPPSGDKTYEVTEDGVYLLNLKSDTLIGSAVNFGETQRTAINAEELEHLIDSTQKLLRGENASDEQKTFFLPPHSIKKITTNVKAQLLSPYKNIPYEVTTDEKGNAPEMYKFFTNKQKREALKELIDRLSS